MSCAAARQGSTRTQRTEDVFGDPLPLGQVGGAVGGSQVVPGRSGKVYGDWLTARGQAFRDRVQVATLDPFHGSKNAIDDNLDAPPRMRGAMNRAPTEMWLGGRLIAPGVTDGVTRGWSGAGIGGGGARVVGFGA